MPAMAAITAIITAAGGSVTRLRRRPQKGILSATRTAKKRDGTRAYDIKPGGPGEEKQA